MVTLVERPELIVAAVGHVGPYDGVGAAFDELWWWLQAHPEVGPVGQVVALSLDDPDVVPAQQLRSFAAAEVAHPELIGTGEVRRMVVPAGRYAVLTHRGSYAGLPGAWRSAGAELAAAGIATDPARTCYESYLNSPAEVPPEELLTELLIPVA